MISSGERPQTYALDSAATGTGKDVFIQVINCRETQQFITQNILMATCFGSIESLSGLSKNRYNIQVSDTYIMILTVIYVVSVWDPRMHYKC